MSDQIDLLVEQVKMLAGEIAFSTSTLKRLVEQSVNGPESSKAQVYIYSVFLSILCIIMELVLRSCYYHFENGDPTLIEKKFWCILWIS